MSRARGQRGFTLLELLITLSVTTIGLIGLISLHLSITRGNDGASRSADAEQVAASELEQMRSMTLGNLMTKLTGSTTLSVPASTPPHTATGRTGMTYNVMTTVNSIPSASASLLKIRTQVTWAEDGATYGSNGGTLDHVIALEIIRTVEDDL